MTKFPECLEKKLEKKGSKRQLKILILSYIPMTLFVLLSIIGAIVKLFYFKNLSLFSTATLIFFVISYLITIWGIYYVTKSKIKVESIKDKVREAYNCVQNTNEKRYKY